MHFYQQLFIAKECTLHISLFFFIPLRILFLTQSSNPLSNLFSRTSLSPGSGWSSRIPTTRNCRSPVPASKPQPPSWPSSLPTSQTIDDWPSQSNFQLLHFKKCPIVHVNLCALFTDLFIRNLPTKFYAFLLFLKHIWSPLVLYL